MTLRGSRVARAAALVTACHLMLACGTEPTEPDVVPGVYNLLSVGSKALPATIFRDSALQVAVLGGTVILTPDSQFLDIRRYRIIAAGQSAVTQTDTLTGVYSASTNTIAFNAADGSRYEMIWVGRSLGWYVEGFTYRFWK